MLDLILWLLPVAAALAVIFSQNLLHNVLAMAVFSLGVAILFLSLSAPDVAITEAAIGAALSTIFLLVTLKVTKTSSDTISYDRTPAKIVIIALVLVMISIVYTMPQFGAADSMANSHVGKYYTENTMADTGIPNAVTSTLASYRGFDTLGEIYVIFTAGLAVILILPLIKKVKKP